MIRSFQLTAAAILAILFCVTITGDGTAAEPVVENPRLGLHFVELPPTIDRLRFVFACPDGLEIEAKWVAQNVGDVAPPNTLIDSVKMKTQGPLNVVQLSRPTNGWPLGMYRLELSHNNKTFHVVRYVIEDLDVQNGSSAR